MEKCNIELLLRGEHLYSWDYFNTGFIIVYALKVAKSCAKLMLICSRINRDNGGRNAGSNFMLTYLNFQLCFDNFYDGYLEQN